MSMTTRSHDKGQALVEFSLAITVFLTLLVGVFDIGRGIYMYNGVAEAARDLGRITATHIGSPVGNSAATTARLASLQAITPGLATPTYACVDITGAGASCASGHYVRVTTTAPYSPVSFLGMLAPVTLGASSTVQIP